MKIQDLLFTEELKDVEFERLAREAVSYAILSIPFTFDRLGIPDLHRKILNIAKGKLAELLFLNFAHNVGIPINTARTETPFYKIDRRDFEVFGNEWDLKNNYLEHHDSFLPFDEYLKLPCLIPNRGPWDQWSKRNYLQFVDSRQSGHIFTFMKKRNPGARREFLDFKMTFAQEQMIRKLYEKYEGKSQNNEPYSEDDFFRDFNDISGEFTTDIIEKPRMIITGYASQENYIDFLEMPPSKINSPYINTIIKNMGIEVSKLPSFKSLI